MKRITALFVLAFMMVLVTACGGSASAATQEAAASQAPASAGNANEVMITLIDNNIQSSQTEFKVGVPYTFVITNTGRHAHNLNISTPVSVAGSLNAALDGALLKVTQNQLGGGQSVTVEYTFPDSAAGQNLEFSCLIRRHYDDGMYLAITVTK